jgi:hypothetical protein
VDPFHRRPCKGDLTISVPGHFNIINYMSYFCASKAWRAGWFGKNGELIVNCQN